MLELLQPITVEAVGDSMMMHEPTDITDGIEVSPNDQIIAVRPGAYVVAAAELTGRWQPRGTLAAGGHEPALSGGVSPPATR
jgi:catalase